jgi:hypothetical protein
MIRTKAVITKAKFGTLTLTHVNLRKAQKQTVIVLLQIHEHCKCHESPVNYCPQCELLGNTCSFTYSVLLFKELVLPAENLSLRYREVAIRDHSATAM